jgi:threonine dehydrogenase-like Zn-dependent dehydrogenase
VPLKPEASGRGHGRSGWAAVMTARGRTEQRRVTVPAATVTTAILRIEIAGICGSDWAYYSGKLGRDSPYAPPPLVLGHEIVGCIVEIGAQASERWGVRVDDRVVVEPTIACNACGPCETGRFEACLNKRHYGLSSTLGTVPEVGGGYAQYLVLQPRSIVHRVAPTIAPREAVLFGPVANGLEWCQAGSRGFEGSTVVVIGPGQHGLGCVVGAIEAGAANVILAGLANDEARLEVGRQLGAATTVDVAKESLSERLRTLTGDSSADVAIDTSGTASGRKSALDIVRPGGEIILAGLVGDESGSFDLDQVVRRRLRVRGVYAHPRSPTATTAAMRLMETGKYPLALMATTTLPLARVDEGLRLVGRQMATDTDPVHVAIDPWMGEDGEQLRR